MKLALLLMLGVPLVLFAQPLPPDTLWTINYDGGGWMLGYDVTQTDDGGFMAVGKFVDIQNDTMGFGDVRMVKLDSAGQIEWENTIGWPLVDDQVMDVCQTTDGGYFMIGITCRDCIGFGDFGNYLLIRTDRFGDTLWTREYDLGQFDWGWSAAQIEDGGFIVTGPGGASGGAVLMRIDVNGDSLWKQEYAGPAGHRQAYCVKQTADQGFVLTGVASSADGNPYDVLVIRTDPDGALMWERTYGRPDRAESANSIVQTADGGFAIVGSVYVEENLESEYLVLRLNPVGDTLWVRTFGHEGVNGDEAFAIIETDDGGFMLGGSTYYFTDPPVQEFQMMKITAAGEREWLSTVGTGHLDQCFDMCPTRDGGYVMAGITWDPLLMEDVYYHLYLVRFGAAGSSSAAPGGLLPVTAALHQNYPNPFNPATEIAFELPRAMPVKLTVYDMLGRELRVLAQGDWGAGSHVVSFNGAELPSGLYFYRLEGEGLSLTRRMLLLK